MELKGSTGIVTGASRGIGVFLAEALAAKRVNLALVARSEEDLEATAARVRRRGVEVIAVSADVTSRSDLEVVVQRTRAELGPVGLLVNNAGIERYGHFESYDPEIMRSILETNVLGAMWLTRLVLPEMVERGRGHVVNIASVAGKTAVPYNPVYSASKLTFRR